MKRFFLTAGLAVALCAVASLVEVPGFVSGTSADAVGDPGIIVKSNSNSFAKAPRSIAYGDTAIIVPDANSGIFAANYTYTDPKTGEVYGFNVDAGEKYDWGDTKEFEVRSCAIAGIKTYGEYASFPEYVKIVTPAGFVGAGTVIHRVKITQAAFRHDLLNEGLETSFPRFTDEEFEALQEKYDYAYGASNVELSRILLPKSITSISWTGKFNTSAHNFYLDSPAPPTFYCDAYSKGTLVLFVDDELLTTYREYVKSNYSDYTLVVRSTTPLSPTNVNVEEPGTLASELSKIAPNLQDVKWVVVTGKPNSEDLRFFRRLPNLEILDLSQTTGLTEISGCNGLEYLREVILPETGTITEIGRDAFRECRSLQTINIPEGVTKIGETAFFSTLLDSIHLSSSVREIGREAFMGSKLRKINLENVESTGYMSCGGLFLEKIDLSNIRSIGEYSFQYNGSLKEVVLGDSLQKIDYSAFASCDLRRVSLPNGEFTLRGYIFSDNRNLKYIEFSSNNNIDIESSSFINISPDTIVVKYLFPLETSGFSNNDLPYAKVFVPALTYNNFLLSDAWAACPNIFAMEENLDELTLDRYFNLRSETGIAEKAHINLTSRNTDSWSNNKEYGQLSVKRKTDLNAGRFEMTGKNYDEQYWTDYGGAYSVNYEGATFIPNSTVTADNVSLHLSLQTDRWHFLSFPFNVKVKDIEVEDEALWVVRHYSGENRANMNGDTWQNLQEEDVLKAGEGYIFHCAKEGKSEVEFTFNRTQGTDNFFEFNKISTPLNSYPSEFAHNANWNLVGNSYPAYLNLKSVDFDAPITVWDGSTYMAYSPVDDELALNPFQAFFVQLQEIEGGDAVELNAWGRAHSEEDALAIEIPANDDEDQGANKARAARKSEPRSLFNITISNGTVSDRTRLVVNELASVAYESNRDASKFMSSSADAPQIFVMNGNQRMAIDERPFGEGVYNLGIYAPKKGEYSLSLAGTGLEGYTTYIFDSLNNTTTELGDVDYIFSSNGGVDEGRFQLILRRGIETGVDEVAAAGIVIAADGNILRIEAPAEVEISVVEADGKVVAAGTGASFTTVLAEGIYVVKAGEAVKKVIIR
ncbi:MAG: leucine-rich repeat domain-containing protein [Bacteroidales bacterium]|nr:leucine-rich repeat domain-containing protein [Bacteroidales bacterium]